MASSLGPFGRKHAAFWRSSAARASKKEQGGRDVWRDVWPVFLLGGLRMSRRLSIHSAATYLSLFLAAGKLMISPS